MTGNRLARLSLRIDAVYCMTLGLLVGVTAPLTASGVVLPPALLIGIGAATFVWCVCVWCAASRTPIRASARLVMVANVVASLALAMTGLVAGTVALTLAAFALSLDVAAFAVSQGIALRRIRAVA